MVKFHNNALEVRFTAYDVKEDHPRLMRAMLTAIRWLSTLGISCDSSYFENLTSMLEALLSAKLDKGSSEIIFSIPTTNAVALRNSIGHTLLYSLICLDSVPKVDEQGKQAIIVIARMGRDLLLED